MKLQMKHIKLYFGIIIALGCYSAQAQDPYQSPQPSDGNYILARTYQKEKNSSAEITLEDDVIENIQYFDGLGRGQQSIAIGQSPLGADMVTPLRYDAYGRVVQEWLPFPATDDGVRGNYQAASPLGIQQFYQTQYPNDFTGMATTEVNAYSEKQFEASPLNRLLKQAAPGKDWGMLATGDDHTVELAYETNATNEVRMFAVTTILANNTYQPTLVFLKDDQNVDMEYYTSGELSKNITYDENHVSGKNHSTETFTDKGGKVVLQRNYADVGAQTEVAHDTYYVYDDFGNLTFVLSPKMEAGSATLTVINTRVDELGYQYVYDDRNRLVEKKLPGKEWEHIIYNDLDQPIMIQDAVQRTNDEWLFTKYDVFGRVVYTGKMTDSRDRTTIQQNSVDTFSGDLWVTKQGSDRNSEFTEDVIIYYNNGAYPTTGITEILSISYYDDYSFDRANEPTQPTTVFDENLDSRTKGLATGSKVKTLGTAQWITTVSRFDDRGSAVYVYSENEFLGTTDLVETDMDHVGKPITVRSAHTRNGKTIVTIDNFEYDHVGRILKQTQCIGNETLGYSCGATTVVSYLELLDASITNNQTATSGIEVKATNNAVTLSGTLTLKVDANAGSSGGDEELITYNQYDELGQLQAKKVGGAPASTYAATTGLQTVDFAYNIRGWLKQINDPASMGTDLFAYGINYNTADHTGTPLYNGNMAETEWKTANDNVLRWYHYDYDPLNRITAGTSHNGDYDLSNLEYDKNGNITDLQRNGVGGAIDNLTYNFHNSEMSNRLQAVADATGNTEGFVDGESLATEYTYDANGNLLTDENKDITGITYNYLNLPTSIDIKNGNIAYIYDATGGKMQKTVGSSVTTYAGNFVYEDNALQFFNHAEGYVSPGAVEGEYNYIYQFKDHLGNIRLSYADGNGDGDIDVTSDPLTTEIVAENNYYPFGLKHKGYNQDVSTLGNSVAQRYKFGGKELEEGQDLNTYDFGARNYDPALGRWMNIDPLAEQMRRHSPYNYAFNNPVFFIDPDGMFPFGSSATSIWGFTDPKGGKAGIVPFAKTSDPDEEAEEEEEETPPDWFVNTNTGEVVHDRTKVQGDEHLLGDGFEHVATEDEIVDIGVNAYDSSNYEPFSRRYNDDSGKNRNAIVFNLETSIKIMEANDRTLVPRETERLKLRNASASTILPSGMSISIVNESISEIWSNVTYVPNNYLVKYDNIEVRSFTLLPFGTTRTVTENKLSYHKPNIFETLLYFGTSASHIYNTLSGSLSAGSNEFSYTIKSK